MLLLNEYVMVEVETNKHWLLFGITHLVWLSISGEK